MQKSKRITLAATLALYANGVEPTRAQVQSLKTTPEHSTARAIGKLAPDTTLSEKLQDEAKMFLKLLRRKDDRWLRINHPHMHNLWNDGTALPHGSGDTQGISTLKPPTVPTGKQLLEQYNRLLKLKSLSPIKIWKESRKALEKRIVKLRQSIEHDIPAWRTYPAAVAEGAYGSDIEATYKTGHTLSGPSRGAEKRENIKQRHIAKRLKDDPNTPQVSVQAFSPNKRVMTPANGKHAPSGVISLADIARTIDMDPRVARAKARREKKKLSKLEVKGSKYKFLPTHTAAVVAILRGA